MLSFCVALTGQKTIESVAESILQEKLTSAERRIEHLSGVRHAPTPAKAETPTI